MRILKEIIPAQFKTKSKVIAEIRWKTQRLESRTETGTQLVFWPSARTEKGTQLVFWPSGTRVHSIS